MSEPTKILTCSVMGCSAAWYEFAGPNRISHVRAVRRARIAGWTSDGDHGCICADRTAFCPDHALARHVVMEDR